MDNNLITDDRKDIDDVLKHFVNQETPALKLEGLINTVRLRHHNNHLHHQDWTHTFIMIGSCAKSMIYDKFDQDKFVALLQAKHNKYGGQPLRSWGPLGVIIRIDSKFQRYTHLTSTQQSDTEDTIIDIIGYAVLGYRLVNEKR
jgi:hypothetical protein